MELQPGEKEEFLTEIYKALASISTLREKVRTLVASHQRVISLLSGMLPRSSASQMHQPPRAVHR